MLRGQRNESPRSYSRFSYQLFIEKCKSCYRRTYLRTRQAEVIIMRPVHYAMLTAGLCQMMLLSSWRFPVVAYSSHETQSIVYRRLTKCTSNSTSSEVTWLRVLNWIPWEDSNCGLLQEFVGHTEENHETTQSEEDTFRPRLKTDTVQKSSIFWNITIRWKSTDVSEKHVPSLFSYLLQARFVLGIFFDPEDGGDMFLRNVGWLSADYMALYHRRYNSSYSPVWGPRILQILYIPNISRNDASCVYSRWNIVHGLDRVQGRTCPNWIISLFSLVRPGECFVIFK
jgi:hypothetical protein